MSLGNRLTIDVPGHRIHPHSVLFAGYECVCTRASRRMFRKELMRSGAAGACTNTVGWWLNSQQPAAAVDSIGRVPTLFSCCIAPMLSSASPLIHTHSMWCVNKYVRVSVPGQQQQRVLPSNQAPMVSHRRTLSLRNVAQLVRPCRHTLGVMLHDAV